MRVILLIVFTFFLVSVIGCSSHSMDNTYPNMPGALSNITDLSSQSLIALDGDNAIGMIGAYELSISPDMKYELTPLRPGSLGESYIVSGEAYFRISPCSDCLKVKSVALNSDGNIVLGLLIKHPFAKGDVSQPPSARNRLDLDIFDLALIAAPVTGTQVSFPLTGAVTYSSILVNADGYTCELSNVISDPSALPYKICYESQSNNRFAMGTDYQPFDLVLKTGSTFKFTLYLTMGYGASAKRSQRLNPTYYVPEFNRKAAWKIVVEQPSPPVWRIDEENTLTIQIYDWNHGKTVATNYPDPAHTDQLSAKSDIESVTVEVPGVSNQLITATTTDTSTNGWDDPITYTAKFKNEMGCTYGRYTGIVKVVDSRTPGTSVVGGETDTLVNSPDGKSREWFEMLEFATYQTFDIDVSSLYWVRTWGGTENDGNWSSVTTDNNGNIYTTNQFRGTVDFNPEGTPDVHTATNGSYCGDIFLCKYTSDGTFCWARTWGGPVLQISTNVATDNMGYVYITGVFNGTVDFDPGPGGDPHTAPPANGDAFLSKFDANGNFQWALSWGGNDNDVGYGLKINNLDSNCIYVSGHFHNTVDFNPDPIEVDWHSANGGFGGASAFMIKFDSTGDYLWGKSWGPDTGPLKIADCTSINMYGSNNVFGAGWFTDSTDFDPGLPDVRPPYHSGAADAFLCKYDKNGNFIWVKTWGSAAPEGDNCTYSLPIDSSGNIYPSGMFTGTVDFDPGSGVAQFTSNNTTDSFLSSFDPNGNFRWATIWGGENADHESAQCAAINSQNEIYVIGYCNGTVDFDPGPGEDVHVMSTNYCTYITKFDSNGNYLKSLSTPETPEYSLYSGITVDNEDNVLYSGRFPGTFDFDFGSYADLITSNGSFDISLVKFCY